MAFLTKEIFKSDWIDKASGQTDADALIGRLIDMVSAEIKSICNQPIEAEAVTLSGANESLRRTSSGTAVAAFLVALNRALAPVSSTALGGSLTPVTVKVTRLSAVPPLPSLIT